MAQLTSTNSARLQGRQRRQPTISVDAPVHVLGRPRQVQGCVHDGHHHLHLNLWLLLKRRVLRTMHNGRRTGHPTEASGKNTVLHTPFARPTSATDACRRPVSDATNARRKTTHTLSLRHTHTHTHTHTYTYAHTHTHTHSDTGASAKFNLRIAHAHLGSATRIAKVEHCVFGTTLTTKRLVDRHGGDGVGAGCGRSDDDSHVVRCMLLRTGRDQRATGTDVGALHLTRGGV
jgi:hypothetical protein